jgi:hypothetical protein
LKSILGLRSYQCRLLRAGYVGPTGPSLERGKGKHALIKSNTSIKKPCSIQISDGSEATGTPVSKNRGGKAKGDSSCDSPGPPLPPEHNEPGANSTQHKQSGTERQTLPQEESVMHYANGLRRG